MMNHFLSLLRASLWGMPYDLKEQEWSHEQYQTVMKLAKEQAVAGLIGKGLMDSGVKLQRADALEVFSLMQQIQQRNAVMDNAVVELCQMMEKEGIRVFVFKGQTVATLYPDPLRQSGDIDFLCHPEDWKKAIAFATDKLGVTIKNHNSQKHVEWEKDGVQFEMHRMLTAFAYPRHQHYWDRVVMNEVLNSETKIDINGYAVPVLPPTINLLYTFVHIFYHLLIEGIGLRQCCDVALLINCKVQDKQNYNTESLEKHLEGIGLKKAFTALGAMLICYIGLPKDSFPFILTDDDKQDASKLLHNILERGNFGHNVHYSKSRGPIHGLQHLWEMGKQARTFYHLAPAEALWRIPEMFKWWGIKIKRMVAKGEVKNGRRGEVES